MHGVPFEVQSYSLVSQRLEVMVIEAVHVLVAQVVQFLNWLTVTIFHPVEVLVDLVIINPGRLDLIDVGTPIVADLVENVIVIVNKDGDCDDSSRQSITAELVLQSLSVSDIERQARHDDFLLWLSQLFALAGWVEAIEFGVATLHGAIDIGTLNVELTRVIVS